jgi:hypothetical protein
MAVERNLINLEGILNLLPEAIRGEVIEAIKRRVASLEGEN